MTCAVPGCNKSWPTPMRVMPSATVRCDQIAISSSSFG